MGNQIFMKQIFGTLLFDNVVKLIREIRTIKKLSLYLASCENQRIVTFDLLYLHSHKKNLLACELLNCQVLIFE